LKNKNVYKGIECLNCGQPLNVHDDFCSNCGQKNDIRKPQFFQLLSEFFSSFYSLDSKFLRTIFPLLFKPGKVTSDFFEGKRLRYMNPFRFYINVSIIFFLIQGIVGFFETFSTIEQKDTKPKISENIKLDSVGKEKLDSILVAENIDIKEIDSAKNHFNLDLSDSNEFFKKFKLFQDFYTENKELSTESALDSLNYPLTFYNQFLYKKSKDLVRLQTDKAYQKTILSKINSSISIALFLMLPFFALFFSLMYIRSDKTYMEHLVFIFHTQSVFFIMLSVFFLFDTLLKTSIGIVSLIFLFGFYLYKAMRYFYKQSRFRTIVKYLTLISIFTVLSVLNLVFLSLFSFATN